MDQIKTYLERPKVYYNIDGVGELGIGFMCLAYGLFAWLQLHAPRNSVWHQSYTWLIYMFGMVAVIHYGSQAIKNRITYPRTGFVDYSPRDKYWTPMALGASGSALLAAGLYLAARQHWQISLAPLIGLLFAASYIRIARTVRWKWTVFVIMVLGTLVIALLPPDVLEDLANHTSPAPGISARTAAAWWLTFVLYGSLLFVSGGVSFWLYVQHTQPPEQHTQPPEQEGR